MSCFFKRLSGTTSVNKDLNLRTLFCGFLLQIPVLILWGVVQECFHLELRLQLDHIEHFLTLSTPLCEPADHVLHHSEIFVICLCELSSKDT